MSVSEAHIRAGAEKGSACAGAERKLQKKYSSEVICTGRSPASAFRGSRAERKGHCSIRFRIHQFFVMPKFYGDKSAVMFF
jgi:hypothetical protein